jgi:small subunit ribosomal protein S2
MIEAGVFFGRNKNHANPRMKNYVLHNRNGMEIFNLHSTLESLETAMAALKNVVADGGTVLFVATQPAFSDLVESVITETQVPSVTKRWLGGTLTNFGQISTRVNHLKKLRADLHAGVFEKYTKKERVDIEREMNKLQGFLGSIENMGKMPDIMVVIDPTEHATAVREAKRMKVPVIAFANVDADPEMIKYVVPGNNRGRKSVSWFLEHLSTALKTPRRAPAITAESAVSTGVPSAAAPAVSASSASAPAAAKPAAVAPAAQAADEKAPNAASSK